MRVRLEVAANPGSRSSRAARIPLESNGRSGLGTAFDETDGLRLCTRRYCSQREQSYPVTATFSRASRELSSVRRVLTVSLMIERLGLERCVYAAGRRFESPLPPEGGVPGAVQLRPLL